MERKPSFIQHTKKEIAARVLSALAIIAGAPGCSPTPLRTWNARYCVGGPCTEYSNIVVHDGYLNPADPRTCPATVRVQTGSVKVGKVSIPIYRTDYYKEECFIVDPATPTPEVTSTATNN